MWSSSRTTSLSLFLSDSQVSTTYMANRRRLLLNNIGKFFFGERENIYYLYLSGHYLIWIMLTSVFGEWQINYLRLLHILSVVVTSHVQVFVKNERQEPEFKFSRRIFTYIYIGNSTLESPRKKIFIIYKI